MGKSRRCCILKRDKLEKLYLEYKPMIQKFARVAYSKLHKPSYMDLEDLEQEGFQQLVKSAKHPGFRKSPVSYLKQALVHCYANLVKQSFKRNAVYIPISEAQAAEKPFDLFCVEVCHDVSTALGQRGEAVFGYLASPDPHYPVQKPKRRERARMAGVLDLSKEEVEMACAGIRDLIKSR